MIGIGLGEMGHSQLNYAMPGPVEARLRKRVYTSVCLDDQADLVCQLPRFAIITASNFSGLRPESTLVQ